MEPLAQLTAQHELSLYADDVLLYLVNNWHNNATFKGHHLHIWVYKKFLSALFYGPVPLDSTEEVEERLFTKIYSFIKTNSLVL